MHHWCFETFHLPDGRCGLQVQERVPRRPEPVQELIIRRLAQLRARRQRHIRARVFGSRHWNRRIQTGGLEAVCRLWRQLRRAGEIRRGGQDFSCVPGAARDDGIPDLVRELSRPDYCGKSAGQLLGPRLHRVSHVPGRCLLAGLIRDRLGPRRVAQRLLTCLRGGLDRSGNQAHGRIAGVLLGRSLDGHPRARISGPAEHPGFGGGLAPGLGGDRLAWPLPHLRGRGGSPLALSPAPLRLLGCSFRSRADFVPERQHCGGPDVALPRLDQPLTDVRGGLVPDLPFVRQHLLNRPQPRLRVPADIAKEGTCGDGVRDLSGQPGVPEEFRQVLDRGEGRRRLRRVLSLRARGGHLSLVRCRTRSLASLGSGAAGLVSGPQRAFHHTPGRIRGAVVGRAREVGPRSRPPRPPVGPGLRAGRLAGPGR